MVLSWEDGIFLSMKLNRGIAVAVDSVVVAVVLFVVAVVILVVVEVAVVAEEETMVVAVDSANLVTFPQAKRLPWTIRSRPGRIILNPKPTP
ncbi:unnamed protein product [Brassica rapa]|uniref:Uncharacterized protein n=2 Tax=Brassica TaxID=3705 RepID=A0A8D9M3E2_BRACM|nr:unnamed protein product [Brassica napus]CAG7897127.1 unnamed protein product [Brassica rapa]